MTLGIVVDLARRMFGIFLTLLAALVFGALLVLAVDIVGIVHQFVVVRAIVGVAVDLV